MPKCNRYHKFDRNKNFIFTKLMKKMYWNNFFLSFQESQGTSVATMIDRSKYNVKTVKKFIEWKWTRIKKEDKPQTGQNGHATAKNVRHNGGDHHRVLLAHGMGERRPNSHRTTAWRWVHFIFKKMFFISGVYNGGICPTFCLEYLKSGAFYLCYFPLREILGRKVRASN